MRPTPAVQRIVLAVAVLLLLVLAWTGLSGGIHDFSAAQNVGQEVQTLAQLAYGLLSLLTVTTVHWAHRGRAVIQGCWTACVAVAAGLASVVWGDAGAIVGLVSAAGALLIALAILWLLRFGTHNRRGA
jgi:hypothetical protein